MRFSLARSADVLDSIALSTVSITAGIDSEAFFTGFVDATPPIYLGVSTRWMGSGWDCGWVGHRHNPSDLERQQSGRGQFPRCCLRFPMHVLAQSNGKALVTYRIRLVTPTAGLPPGWHVAQGRRQALDGGCPRSHRRGHEATE